MLQVQLANRANAEYVIRHAEIGDGAQNEMKRPLMDSLDALDPLPPRDGEPKVLFSGLIECIAERLHIDLASRADVPFDENTADITIPFLILPVRVELRDLKTLLCNLNVPIRRLYIAQIGGVPQTTMFLGAIARTFAFTHRLFLKRVSERASYAAALNAGLQEALSLPFDEVPFVHISNCDVRYPESLLHELLPVAYMETTKDEAVIKDLQVEVSREPNAHTPEHFRAHLLRKPYENANKHDPQLSLVTSAALPDRIRYLPQAELAKQFAGHIATFYMTEDGGPQAYLLSRLAVEAAGYFDENFYPGFLEDCDLRWRLNLLGFAEQLLPSHLPMVKVYGDGVFSHVPKADQNAGGGHDGATLPPEAVKEADRMKTAFQSGFSLRYAVFKWGVQSETEFSARQAGNLPYRGLPAETQLPLDAWVFDATRAVAIDMVLRGESPAADDVVYHADVIQNSVQ